MADTTSVFYQIGQAVSQKISNTSSGFNGGTITSNITIQKDNPVLYLKDTQSDGAPSNQASYLEYLRSDGSAKGHVGYGTNSDDDLDLKNHMGHIRISPASGHQVYIDNNAVITSANISSYALTSGGNASQIQIGSGIQLKESTNRNDLLEIKGLTSSWAGIQITNNNSEHLLSLMADGNIFGLYDDQQDEWAWQYPKNAGHKFYLNGELALSLESKYTMSLGGQAVAVNNGHPHFSSCKVGTVGTAEITQSGKGRFGGWGTYTSFSGDATEIGVSGGDGWILPYNRSTSSYLPNMNIQCGAKIKLKRDTKGADINGLTQFGPADQTYCCLSISPGPAASGASSYISTFNSNNMGFRTGGTNLGMEITNTGAYVRTPKNPFVLAKKTVHATSSGPIVCDSILSQVGSSYSTSNGYFTAPVTGRYVCSITVLPYSFNTSNTSTLQWYMNGSYYAFGGMYTRMSGNYFGQGNTLTFYLYQGDYVYPYFYRTGSCGLHSNYTTLSITYIG